MYSSFQLAKKYLHYYISAKNGRGHGIHSPFVFDFVTHVLNDAVNYECYDKIESLRQQLLTDKAIIEAGDFGAGSAVIPSAKRKISAIAKSSLKNKKQMEIHLLLQQFFYIFLNIFWCSLRCVSLHDFTLTIH